jgi:hypothetical protein
MSTSRFFALYQYTLPGEETIQVIHEDDKVETMSVARLQPFFRFTYAHGVFYRAEHAQFCAAMRTQFYDKPLVPKAIADFLRQPLRHMLKINYT